MAPTTDIAAVSLADQNQSLEHWKAKPCKSRQTDLPMHKLGKIYHYPHPIGTYLKKGMFKLSDPPSHGKLQSPFWMLCFAI